MAANSAFGPDVRVLDIKTRILYGIGTGLVTGKEAAALGAKRVFIVTDQGVAKAGIAEKIRENVAEAGLEATVWDGVVENPSVESVDAGAAAAGVFRADLLIGLGGGSAMDSAKLMAAMLADGKTSIYSYFQNPKVENPILPVIAIPTTAGTGSEVSLYAIVNKKDTGERLSLTAPSLYATLAILEPEFAAMQPPKLAAATGMDALAHAVEGFISKRASAFGDAMAAEAIRLIGKSLVRLYEEPGNVEAAADMIYASTMAGLVLGLASVCLGHGLSRPFSTFYGIHHGLANAMTLPPIVEFNKPGHEAKYARLAELLGAGEPGMLGRLWRRRRWTRCGTYSGAGHPAKLQRTGRAAKRYASHRRGRARFPRAAGAVQPTPRLAQGHRGHLLAASSSIGV